MASLVEEVERNSLDEHAQEQQLASWHNELNRNRALSRNPRPACSPAFGGSPDTPEVRKAMVRRLRPALAHAPGGVQSTRHSM
jgi:hypothetical protein